MSSQVDIYNMALGHIGTRTTVAAINEKSTEAKKLSLYYDTSVVSVLAAHDWAFAKRSIAMSATGTPPPGWIYQYTYPNSCVKVRKIIGPTRTGDPIPFEIAHSDINDAKVILTDQPGAEVWYTKLITNTELFPAKFVEALAAKLASNVAMPITRKRAVRDDAISIYNLLLEQAKASDLNESGKEEDRLAPWHESRA